MAIEQGTTTIKIVPKIDTETLERLATLHEQQAEAFAAMAEWARSMANDIHRTLREMPVDTGKLRP